MYHISKIRIWDRKRGMKEKNKSNEKKKKNNGKRRGRAQRRKEGRLQQKEERYIQKVWKEEGERSSRYLVNIQQTRIKQGKEDVRSNKLLRVL